MSVKKFVGFPDFRSVLSSIYKKDVGWAGLLYHNEFLSIANDFFNTAVRYDYFERILFLGNARQLPTPVQEKAFVEYVLDSIVDVNIIPFAGTWGIVDALVGGDGYGLVDGETFDELASELFGEGNWYVSDDYPEGQPFLHIKDDERSDAEKELQFAKYLLSKISIEFDPISQRWLTFVTKEEK